MVATGTSSIEIAEVSAATKSIVKKSAPSSIPNWIFAKAAGRVTKTRFTPAAGSRPAVKTRGKIINPARNATSISATAMMEALLKRLPRPR